MILGIDEVGRGCWAGPLVVGAVVLGGAEIQGLTDSKALSKVRRELLHDEITRTAHGVGLGWVDATELDRVGLSAALRLATKRAVREVHASFSEIVIDGTVNFLRETPLEAHVTLMKKADLLVPSVSAASIVAKVSRDRYMAARDAEYAGYGFASHVGYGTAAHRAAIEKLGVCPEHRLSFAPLAKYRSEPAVTVESQASDRQPAGETTRATGDAGETVAAQELIRRGHQIIERNWKTRFCEIDIISHREGIYYFTEVKHRKNARAGDGIAAVTPRKLRQMTFAAEFYAHTKGLHRTDMRLLAIATSGHNPEVVSYIEIT